MSTAAHEAYLETQILTATPQKLRLLLIDGALRFARQALEYGDDENLVGQRCTAMARCNDILTELYATISDDGAPVTRQVRDIYRFLLLRMSDAACGRQADALSDVVAVLESERETWRQLCEKMPEAPERPRTEDQPNQDVSTAGLGAIGPVEADATEPAPHQSFSLEA